jgi:hypothetical protein
MDLDTAAFLHACEELADDFGNVTEDALMLAFALASVDVLTRATPATAVKALPEIRRLTRLVSHHAEAEGYTIVWRDD